MAMLLPTEKMLAGNPVDVDGACQVLPFDTFTTGPFWTVLWTTWL
jgi:hypothetical protein